MPWKPLPRIAFAVAVYPFAASSPADLPLELGDELYVIEQGGAAGEWYRGYLVAPPSLLSGLTSVKGQTLEARVFSGIFPRNCVEVREVLDDTAPETNGSAIPELAIGASGSKVPNGYALGNQTSPQHRKSVRRISSLQSPSKDKRPSAPTEAQESGIEQRKNQPASNGAGRGPNLSRQLSHRSMQSIRSQEVGAHSTSTGVQAKDQPPAPVPMLKIGDETPTSLSEPLVDEIASCLREWHSKDLHEMLLTRRYAALEQLATLIRRLDILRRQLLHGVFTAKELAQKRDEAVWYLVKGNKLLGGEIIVRDAKHRGRLLTSNDSAVEMAKLQSAMALLDQPPVIQSETVNLRHLMLEIKDPTHCNLEAPLVSICLCTRSMGERPNALTETLTISIPTSNETEQERGLSKQKTLFTDLTSTDIGLTPGQNADLFVVVRIFAIQTVEQPTPQPTRKESQAETRRSPSASRENDGPAAQSLRRGRQSLMWAQRQFGSTRRRNAPDLQTPLASRNGSTVKPMQDRSRPNTPQSLRPSTGQGSSNVRRLVAVGVLSAKDLVAQVHSKEQRLTLWTPAANSGSQHHAPAELELLLAEFLPSVSGRYMQSASFGYIDVGLQAFSSPDADHLISKTPTLLQGICQTPKLSFSGAPDKARSDIYVTMSEACLPVKALLSHPERGPVPLPPDIDYDNLQLTLEVRKKSGERIERCIHPDSNSPGVTAWRTVAVERGRNWDQIVKLVVPEADVPEAHIVISIANAPGFPFALCWMPLWDQDAFIRDGQHMPLLYLYDKVTSSSDKGRGAYLALPWNSRAKDNSAKDEAFTGPVATLKLQTYLCSTIFSQDRVLVGLLKWRDQSEEQLLGSLRQFTFVPEIDIVKIVDDLLDAFFGILVNNAGKEEYEDLVFNGLVAVLVIIHDRRFNLGPLIDKYTETRFDYPFATPCLIRSYLRILARPADPQNSRRLHATIKVGRQMLRFITTARIKQKAKEDAIGVSNDLSFRRDYRNIFSALEAVMRDPSPILVGSKTLIVQHLHSWLPSGNDTFSEDEVYEIVSSFLSACSAVQGKLILYKLLLILHLSNPKTFNQDSLRERFAASSESWMDPYWGVAESPSSQWRDQIRICCSILSAQAEAYGISVARCFVKIVESYQYIVRMSDGRPAKEALEMMFPTSHPFPARPLSKPSSFDEPLVELAALLSACAGKDLLEALSRLGEERVTVISAVLDVLASVLEGEAFPHEWLSLHIYYHRSALHILETLHETMTANFLPLPEEADEFNTAIWSKFFGTLLKVVGSKTLALETFAEQKRRAVWKIAGDVREQGADLLRRSWEAIGWESSTDDQRRYGVQRIGGYQVQYVPSLVAPIVGLCLSVHEGLRRTAVRVLQTMIVSEWTLSEDLSVIEAEMIDCLDHTFTSRNFAESVTQKLFVTELLDLFEPLARIPGDGLWQAIKVLLSTIDELLDLFAAVHSPEINEAVRIMQILQLMDYLRDMRKEAIFIRYVHQLANVQSQSQHPTEAGLAIRLHAALYQWTSTPVAALVDPAFPDQTSFERKEQLYFEMIKHFEEGAAWDCALASYKELADQYEHHLYDFVKLARTQHSMARIYESIARGERQSRRFFKVQYRGLGFSDNLRDKDFIFQGESSERQTAFADRLREQHPAAQIIPSGDLEDIEGQFLHVSPVAPYRDLQHLLYQQSKVPQSVREYVLQSSPSRFAVTSQRHSPATGVENQWIEKTVYTTTEAFPTILGRSEIISTEIVHLTPLQTAVERTSRKTTEMSALQKRITDGDDSAFPTLIDNFKTSTDPTALASVSQYRDLIPPPPPEPTDSDDESIAKETPLDPMQNALKQALLDHASTLRQCLPLFSDPELQISLSQSLSSTFAPEMALLAPPAATTTSRPSTAGYGVQTPSLPPSRGFSSDLPLPNPLSNGITALPQSGGSTEAPPPIPRTRSRLSLSFLKTPGAKTNVGGAIDQVDGSASKLALSDDFHSQPHSHSNGSYTHSTSNGAHSSNQNHSAESQQHLLSRPGTGTGTGMGMGGRLKSLSSNKGEEEAERPMTAQSA
ncbi:MAG: hypothetical protein Q9174_002162, partial [Haloplaca sp. 1 TL-2023]